MPYKPSQFVIIKQGNDFYISPLSSSKRIRECESQHTKNAGPNTLFISICIVTSAWKGSQKVRFGSCLLCIFLSLLSFNLMLMVWLLPMMPLSLIHQIKSKIRKIEREKERENIFFFKKHCKHGCSCSIHLRKMFALRWKPQWW